MSDPRTILSSVPLPVARILARAWTAKSALERHNAAVYALEATIKLATSARIVAWLVEAGDDERTLRAIAALERGSLGQWVEAFRRTGPTEAIELAAGVALVERLRAAEVASKDAAREVRRRGVGALFEAAVAYRNQVIGHGSQRPPSFYAALEVPWRDAVVEVLQVGRPFGTGRLLVAPGEPPEPWLDLMGPLPLPTESPTGSAGSGHVVLSGPDGLLDLHPLVAHDEDPTLDRHRVGFLNRVKRGRGAARAVKRVDYLDYATGATLQVGAADAVHAFFERVGQLGEASGSGGSVATGSDTGAFVGPYRLQDELGRGAMGVVYGARHAELGTRVALKLLSQSLATDDVARQRFAREVRALARVEHPNVVGVIDADASADRPYYAMELVDGTDLSSGVELTPSEAAGLFAGAAEGLHALHDEGVVHRDLKPANLMLTADRSRLVVMDLGLARLADASRGLTHADAGVLGTLRYAPPEQIEPKRGPVDGRSDVYALGATLFEALTGRPMVPGDGHEALVKAVLLDDVPGPRDVAPSVPAGLDAIVRKATAKDARDRYSDSAAFAADLRAFGDGAPLSARPPTTLQRVRYRLRGRGLVVAASAAAIVLATVAGAAAWDRSRTKVTRHPHVVWRNGAPEGVGDWVDGGPAGFEVTRHGGRVVHVRRIHGRGASIPWLPERVQPDDLWVDGVASVGELSFPCMDRGNPDTLAIGLCEEFEARRVPWPVSVSLRYDDEGVLVGRDWTDDHGILAAVDEVAWQGDEATIRHLDPAGLPVAGPRDMPVTVERTDADGFVVWRGGRNSAGEPAPGQDGAFAERLSLDPQGAVLQRELLGADDGKLERPGVVTTRIERDGAGWPVGVKTTDEHDRPVLSAGGCATGRMARDPRGWLLRHECLGVSDQPLPDSQGCVTRTYTVDDDGWSLTCVGSDGQPISRFGWSTLEVGLDEGGRPVSLAFTDPNGDPVPARGAWQLGPREDGATRTGPARLLGERDAEGRIAKVSWFGPDGAPYVGPAGWASWRVDRDERGLVVRWEHLDEAGQVIENTHGIASMRVERDASGHAVATRIYDAAGQATLGAWGFHLDRTEYTLGQISSWALFGIDDEPVLGANGFHRIRLVHDELGREVERSHWGVDDEPIELVQGHVWRIAYDANGHAREYLYLDARRQPTIGSGGCHRELVEADPHGRPMHLRCEDVDGNLVFSPAWGAAAGTQVWERGRRTRLVLRGPDEAVVRDIELVHDDAGRQVAQKIRDANGAHEMSVQHAYDERGHQIELKVVDADGRPMTGPDGWARMAQTRDTRGNETSRAFFDADDEPMLHRGQNNHDHRRTYVYDDQNRLIELRAFGVQGEPIVSSITGLHGQRWTYDGAGNVVHLESLAPPGMDLPEHVAPQISKQLDAQGRLLRVASLDMDGEPIDVIDHGQLSPGVLSASGEWTYDDQGRLVGYAARRADGSPAPCPAGYSDVVLHWDSPRELVVMHGVGTSSVLLGPGKPWSAWGQGGSVGMPRFLRDDVLKGLSPYDDRGMAGFALELDFNDNIRQVTWLDVSGERVAIRGVAGWRKDFSPANEPVQLTWLDLRGDPVVHPDRGWAWKSTTYDPAGRILRERTFDADDRLTDARAGFADRRLSVDPMGNVVSESWWSAAGEPALGPDGCHQVQRTFSGSAELTEDCAPL